MAAAEALLHPPPTAEAVAAAVAAAAGAHPAPAAFQHGAGMVPLIIPDAADGGAGIMHPHPQQQEQQQQEQQPDPVPLAPVGMLPPWRDVGTVKYLNFFPTLKVRLEITPKAPPPALLFGTIVAQVILAVLYMVVPRPPSLTVPWLLEPHHAHARRHPLYV